MADRLAALMTHFPVHAKVFNAGALCGVTTVEDDAVHGQLHLVRQGDVEVRYGRHVLYIDQPSVLLFPRPVRHDFITGLERGAELVCAKLAFEGGPDNPIALALPELVSLPLANIDGAEPVLQLLFQEAFDERCGRLALIERLFEVVMIQILRVLIEKGELQGGMLSGLLHPRLRYALVAMHEAPEHEWTLSSLAVAAGMSRSVFATAFRATVGITPGQYLQGWRVQLAQKSLRRGLPLKIIAAEVGYGSEAALSRAFKAYAGQSPRQWMAARGAGGRHRLA